MIDACATSVDSLAAIVAIQRQFIADNDSRLALNSALEFLCRVSGSVVGFVGEVGQPNGDAPFLRMHAKFGVDWDEDAQDFFVVKGDDRLPIIGLRDLVGRAIYTGEVANEALADVDHANSTNGLEGRQSESFRVLPCFSSEDTLTGVVVLETAHSAQDADRDVSSANNVMCVCGLIGDLLAAIRRKRSRQQQDDERGRQALSIAPDPSELEESDDASQISDSSYRTFVDYASDAFFLQDSAGRVIDVNRQACISLGYDRDELIGLSPPDFDPNFNPDQVAEVMQVLDRGKTLTFESQHRRKDGTVFPVEIRLGPFWIDGKRHHIAIVRDITDRYHDREKLRNSEKLLATAIADTQKLHEISMRLVNEDNCDAIYQDIVDVAVSVMRADKGNLLLLDPSTGLLSQKGYVGFDESFLPFCQEIPLEMARTACGEAVRSGKRIIVPDICQSEIFEGQKTLQLLTSAGVRAMVSTPLILRNGQPIGTIAVHYSKPTVPDDDCLRRIDLLARQAADLVDRTRSAIALRESEARLRTVLEGLERIAVQAYDPDGSITFWNRASEIFYGYSAAEVKGRDRVDLLIPNDEAREAERRIMAESLRHSEPTMAEEVDVVRRDGKKLTVLSSRLVHRRPGHDPEFFCFDVDITERKRAENSVRQQYAILHTILESSADSIYMKDPRGRYLMVNSAGAAMFGKSVEEIIGRDDTELFPAEIARHIIESDRVVLCDETPHRFADEAETESGRLHRSTVKCPCRDSNGRIIGLVGITRDITERVKAIQTLHETQQRLALILKGARVGLWDRDIKSDRIDSSEECKNQLGFTGEEIGAAFHDWESRIHPDDREMVLEKVQHAVDNCDSDFGVEFRMRHKDGSWRWILSLGFAIPGSDGATERLLGIHLDITERKHAEEALKMSEERSRLALDVASLGTWRREYASNEVHLDDRAQELWSFNSPVVSAADLWSRIFPEDYRRIANQWGASRHSCDRESITSEFRIVLPSGDIRWVSTRGQLFSEHGGSIGEPGRSIGTILDITERKRIEAERERLHQEVLDSREQLRAMSRRVIEVQESERRHLALELHDEIGQILTTVNLCLESLRSRIDPAYVGRLDEGVRVVNQAIEQVRDLSLDLRPASLDILGLEAALRAYAQRICERAGLELEIESSLDRMRISPTLETVCFRVAQEALTNVVRHAQASCCWIQLALVDSAIHVSIRDDGIGFEVAEAQNRALLGEGFGLVGMLERVELFGGRIRISSKLGVGTTVEAHFPLKTQDLCSVEG